tara:strand:- start:2001 stop:2207 length:207 start_codon:yes stop_codon:yes gene_type:complete
MRRGIRSGKTDALTGSLLVIYTLAQALGISPLEIYQMPAQLVQDLLAIHGIVEEIKAEEMEKQTKKMK